MIHIVRDGEGVAASAGRLLRIMLRGRAQRADARVSLVLSGGSTPRRLYELLAGAAGEGIPWERIALFWGDERCVAVDDQRSNYGMVERTGLLGRPLAAVHRMRGELEPEAGARSYEDEIRGFYVGSGRPRFDLVLLGLGVDGHIASLFPDSPGLIEHSRIVLPTDAYEGTHRLTVTLPVLASARSLVFLVSGEEKAEALRGVFSRDAGASERSCPARRLLDMVAVKKMAGWEHPTLTWVIDRPAAALLEGPRLDADSAHR